MDEFDGVVWFVSGVLRNWLGVLLVFGVGMGLDFLYLLKVVVFNTDPCVVIFRIKPHLRKY